MLDESQNKEEKKPLFAHFLEIKPFLILYVTGFLVFLCWLHLSTTILEPADTVVAQIALVIYSFLGPIVYVLTKRIYKEFEEFFKQVPAKNLNWKRIAGLPESEEIGFLFDKHSDFESFRDKVHNRLTSNKATLVSIGLVLVILPLSLLQDFQRELYVVIFNQPSISLAVVEYSFFMVYWAIVEVLLLNIVWMIFTVTHALLTLNREKNLFHISKRIDDLGVIYNELEMKGVKKSDIDVFDFSFKRFTTGLSRIASFVLSLSLKIAFVGGFCSIPAVIYFILTERMLVVWYGLEIVACSLSVIVFILGQYGAWRLWCDAKTNSIKLLNAICSKITMTVLDPQVSEEVKKKIEVDAEIMNQTLENIKKTFAVTYTSSAVFKVASANFLAFGPFVIELLVFRLILT